MKEGDTFWLHICKYEGYPRKKYIPVGSTCKVCDWYLIPAQERMNMNRDEFMEKRKDDN